MTELIRFLRKGDIRQIKELYDNVISRNVEKGVMEKGYAHSEQELLAFFTARRKGLGLFKDDRLEATLWFDPWFKLSAIRIMNVMVREEGKGHAYLLLKKAEEWARKHGKRSVFCFARDENWKLLKWLEKRGFKRVGESEKIYRGRRKALISWKPLQ